MAKRLGKRLAALSAAALLCAASLAIFAPSASAHTATKVVNKYTCTSIYVPEFLSYENKCSFVPTTVNRPHIHMTREVCYWVSLAGAAAGTAATQGNPYGTLAGGAAGYLLCRVIGDVLWLG